MKSFLEHIAQQFKPEKPDSLKDICFVFPSKRAGIYFLDMMRQQHPGMTLWSPYVFSIEEFIQEHARPLVVADNLQLLFRLYTIYIKESEKLPFDEFYAWGNTLLRDFDEIDRYLVDGNKVFTNLREIEKLDAAFGLDEDAIRALKAFQKVLIDASDGKLVKSFEEIWATVRKVYPKFKADLEASSIAYLGLCYRQVAESLQDESLSLPYEKVVFAGFNAISKAEEVIMDQLLKVGKARIFFDADRFYLENDSEEAGKFIRRHRKRWYGRPDVEFVLTNGFVEQKEIDIVGVAQKSVQAKAAATIATNYRNTVGNTAIVLADESLLQPLLYALPEDFEDINITMGYTLAGTPLATLALTYLRYQAQVSVSQDGNLYARREYLNELINEPALDAARKPELVDLKTGRSIYARINEVVKALTTSTKAADRLLAMLLTPIDGSKEAIAVIRHYITEDYYLRKDETDSVLETGIRATILKHLEELEENLSSTKLQIGMDILHRLLRDSFKSLTTPFSGEPLASLQVMGFLETRSLDFDNLVLLSVNEDLIPAGSNSVTFIPFAVRKAFKLPTFLDHNSIYAYHFYRLMQRARNVSIVYSTELSVTGGGEKSRFILQLEQAFGHQESPVAIKKSFLGPPIPNISKEEHSIIIEKKDAVAEAIRLHFEELSGERVLTPTGLTDYIACSLKYYFARILKIRQYEPESPKIDARTFGNLLHEVLEMIFQPFIGQTISKNEIIELRKMKLAVIIHDVFIGFDEKSGEVKFTRQVIHNLADKILENDENTAPITIIDLESKGKNLVYELQVDNHLKLKLGGKIDRLDRVQIDGKDVYRVLDYKTGKVELRNSMNHSKPVPLEEFFEDYFTKPKFKSGFQIFFYLLVIKRMQSNWAINGGLIGIKNLKGGVDYLRQTEAPIDDNLIDIFEERLKKLLLDIADPTLPFSQTNDLKTCSYCEFRRICKRT